MEFSDGSEGDGKGRRETGLCGGNSGITLCENAGLKKSKTVSCSVVRNSL